jgi:hypothetical protein
MLLRGEGAVILRLDLAPQPIGFQKAPPFSPKAAFSRYIFSHGCASLAFAISAAAAACGELKQPMLGPFAGLASI